MLTFKKEISKSTGARHYHIYNTSKMSKKFQFYEQIFTLFYVLKAKYLMYLFSLQTIF